MHRLKLTRNLHTLAVVTLAVALLVGAGLLGWANYSGLPDSWRARIEQELAKEGLYLEIGALSYLPLRGISATGVKVFSDPEMRDEVSQLEHVLLDVDKSRLARGKLHFNQIELRNAQLNMPIDPSNPSAGSLVVESASGTLLMGGSKQFEIRSARGRVSGIDVRLNAKIQSRRLIGQGESPERKAGQGRQLLAQITKELARWEFDPDQAPQLVIVASADMSRRESLEARLELSAENFGKQGHRLEMLHAKAIIQGELLTITQLEARDSRGKLDARMDFSLNSREGRFDVTSTLEIPPLLSAWIDLPPLPGQIVIGGGQAIEAQGELHLPVESKPTLRMTGQFHAESVMLRGLLFDHAESAFAWDDGNLFLRNLHLTRPDGEATGKALMLWPELRVAVHSTLPAADLRPIFQGQALDSILADITPRESAALNLHLEGSFDLENTRAWACTGEGTILNSNFRSVPLDRAHCRFNLNRDEFDFFDGNLVFNHRGYPLREDFGGPEQSSVQVKRIRYDRNDKRIDVEGVVGSVWPAPLVRLFAPSIADDLESYRFHRPPRLSGNGAIYIGDNGSTRLEIPFQSESSADYEFLGKFITLNQPQATVTVNGKQVRVGNLKASVFDGPITASFNYAGKGKLEGELSWTRLDLAALASRYDQNIKAGGQFTGRIQFTMNGGKVETMEGDGLFALEKTELFSVPIFGPLSPLISGVLNDRRAGFERAKSAFCTFQIRRGVLSSQDFTTSTSSLNFAGEGTVNLATRMFDMTMRMNARGLLGLLTLPLRPFSGMFQFRGTGPVNNPEWRNVVFSKPSQKLEELLSNPPKARVISEEP